MSGGSPALKRPRPASDEREREREREWEREWEGLSLPPFAPPPKPASPEGLGALERIALSPQTHERSIFLWTTRLLVAYDAYPKARVHLLILPRQPLAGPKHLTSEHVPLLTHMMSLAEWLVVALAHAHPNSSPLRVGFHAVPTMRQLHLHVISADLDSPCLKNKKHYNSFATDFFVPPERWLAQLKELGRVVVDDHAEEAKLKRDLKCYLTGRALKNIPELKAYLGSPAYAAALDKERSQGPQSHRVAA